MYGNEEQDRDSELFGQAEAAEIAETVKNLDGANGGGGEDVSFSQAPPNYSGEAALASEETASEEAARAAAESGEEKETADLEALKLAAARAAAERERTQREYEAAKKAAKAQQKATRTAERTERRGVSAGACIAITAAGMVLTLVVTFALLFFWRLPFSRNSVIGSLLTRYSQTYGIGSTTQQPSSTVVGGQEVPGGSNVNITIEGDQSDNASAVYAKCDQSVVGIRVVASTSGSPWQQATYSTVSEGSGVIYSADGYVITNHHVIASAIGASGGVGAGYEIRVFLDKSLRSYCVATIVGADATTDLAVLKIQAENLRPIEFADSSTVSVGDRVFAIGSPGGLEFMNSLSNGIVSGINRNISTEDGVAYDLIQTNTAINPGNSGGALLNTEGKLIGICFLKIVAEGYEGMGFAISSNTAKDIINTLIQEGSVSRPQLGITVNTNYTPAAAAEAGLPAGAWVYEVTKGSPADLAGLAPNNIITAFNGVAIEDYYGLRAQLLKCKPGDTVTLTVYRYAGISGSGEYVDLKVTLTVSE